MVDVNGKVSDDFRVHYPSFRLLSPSVIYIRNNTGSLRWWFVFAILALQETDSLPVSSRPAWSIKDLFEEKGGKIGSKGMCLLQQLYQDILMLKN